VWLVVQDHLGIDVPDVRVDLIDSGLLDSLALVTLIVALEETYGCPLPLDDFDIDRFRNVEAIAAFLVTSRARPSGSVR
jgi:acyl carrier protein